MKFSTNGWALAALLLLASLAWAQPPERPRDRPPGGPGPDFRPLRLPLLDALDTDRDFTLSPEEIKNASAALVELDENKDGKLTAEEIMPRGFGRPGGPGGPGRPGEGPRRPGGEPGRPDDPGRPAPPPRSEGPGPGPSPERFIEHAMQFDADDDGKLSRDELAKMAQEMMERRGGPGGPRAGDRPRDGDRRPEGDRPRDGDRRPEGDRPREGDRRPEGDRPRDKDRPREDDRPRDGDRRPEDDRPRDE